MCSSTVHGGPAVQVILEGKQALLDVRIVDPDTAEAREPSGELMRLGVSMTNSARWPLRQLKAWDQMLCRPCCMHAQHGWISVE